MDSESWTRERACGYFLSFIVLDGKGRPPSKVREEGIDFQYSNESSKDKSFRSRHWKCHLLRMAESLWSRVTQKIYIIQQIPVMEAYELL